MGLCLGIVVLSAACGSGFIDKLFSGPYDAGATDGASPDAGVDSGVGCALRHPPVRPDLVDDGTSIGPTVFAFESLRVGDSLTDGGAQTAEGIDLDNACTCPADDSCVPPDGGARRCDLSEGRDNALGPLFSQFFAVFGSRLAGDAFATERIRTGRFSILLSLLNWNGKSNDPRVTVALFLSNGVEPSVDGGLVAPRLDGTDRWTVAPGSLVGGEGLVGTDCGNGGGCFPDRKSVV